jgi:MHS family proline/betaine transporter-like MFS transporter
MIRLLSLGTLLEWAEYTFYGYMGILFSTLFFPESDPHVAMLKTYGIFAAGYFMRPFGAILFGHIGDKFGRKPALTISLLLMGLATLAIGCLPTYATWGMSAASLLLLFRLIQGLAISGEYNGAGILVIEKVKQNPCLASSWISASAAAGMVCGGIAAFLVSHPNAPQWAWRIPFLIGGVSCFLSYFARKNLQESLPVQARSYASPLIEVLKHHKLPLLRTGAIAAFTGVYVYIGNIYIVSFLKNNALLSTYHATFFAILGEIVVAMMIPLMAYYADRSHPFKQYRRGLLYVALFTPVIFMLCQSGHYGLIGIAMILYGVLNGIVCGPMVKILCDQFPVELRYTGISFGWNVAAALFSGTALIVAQFLTSQGWVLGPALYVSIIALITYGILSLRSYGSALRPQMISKTVL